MTAHLAVVPDDEPRMLREPAAEQAILAACLNVPGAVGRVRRWLTPTAFYETAPDHETLFAVLCALDDAGEQTGPLRVYHALAQRKLLGKFDNGAYLHTLQAYPFLDVDYAVGRVALAHRQRARLQVAERMAQISRDVTDPDEAADALARAGVEMQLLVEDPIIDKPVPGLDTWAEFLAKTTPTADEVVPGMLDRQEAVMVLAAPGVGKSWLSRQVALTVAAGVHPFRPTRRIPPMRTLLIDLENPESTVQRQTANPFIAIELLGDEVGDRGHIWRYPAGLNIRKRPDAMLLERVIEQTRPALVCVGSLYNLFQRGRDDWDTAAEDTIVVLNRLRARYRCAWWIEHHMPRASEGGHRQNPFGSTLWERWPSYGRVIARIGGNNYDFAVFRGDREANRDFPVGLTRGGKLPWSAIYDPEELALIKENFA